ncbi:hypothetical protein AMJ85_00635 [candidate division BRC1 bacterium SM23_51]|nr:MAG: hypothetical protein AMJ85_00635 [candidate division BRC1 bacterium SM23_51]
MRGWPQVPKKSPRRSTIWPGRRPKRAAKRPKPRPPPSACPSRPSGCGGASRPRQNSLWCIDGGAVTV